MTHSGGTARRPRPLSGALAAGVALLLAALPGQPAVADVPSSVGTAALPGAVHPVSAHATALSAEPEDLTEGLRVESTTTYTVDLAASQVLVEVGATVTNQTRDSVSGGQVLQTYFPKLGMPILVGATDVAAERGDGRALTVDTEVGDGLYADVAVVDLAPDLFYGDSQEIRLTYRLPTQPLRAGTLSQVNAAYATFPLFTAADPGLGAVVVRAPADLVLDIPGAEMDSTLEEGWAVHTASAIEDPAAWSANVIARDDDALVERLVFYQDTGVLLLGWPGDDEWLDFTADLVERGLPVLRAAMGTAWRQPGQLEIVETTAPYVYGYGGWYERSSSVIEIGDALDPHVTLHELSHAWFNEASLQGRWLNEALADEFAALTMEELGLERPTPEEPGDEGALPLNSWADIDLESPQAEEEEAYGYNASWWFAHQLVEEIGAEALGEVVQAAVTRESPYPSATTSGIDGVADWRTFVDLAETVGGSERVESLVRDYVLTQEELPLLEERTAARAEYAELLEAGDGWVPPAQLRDAMIAWEFEEAITLAPRVEELMERRAEVVATLDGAGLELPGTLQRQFEEAEDVGALEKRWDDVESATDVLVDAADADPVTRLGLLATGAQSHLGAARKALASGDTADAADAAEAAAGSMPRAGLVGLAVLLGLVVFAAGVTVLVVLRRRTARASRRSAPGAEAPDADVPVREVDAGQGVGADDDR